MVGCCLFALHLPLRESEIALEMMDCTSEGFVYIAGSEALAYIRQPSLVVPLSSAVDVDGAAVDVAAALVAAVAVAAAVDIAAAVVEGAVDAVVSVRCCCIDLALVVAEPCCR